MFIIISIVVVVIVTIITEEAESLDSKPKLLSFSLGFVPYFLKLDSTFCFSFVYLIIGSPRTINEATSAVIITMTFNSQIQSYGWNG